MLFFERGSYDLASLRQARFTANDFSPNHSSAGLAEAKEIHS